MRAVSRLSCVGAFLGLALGAQANIIQSSPKSLKDKALFQANTSQNFDAVVRSVRSGFLKFLEGVPGVDTIQVLGSGKFDSKTTLSGQIIKERKFLLLVDFSRSQVQPPSLFRVKEKLIECTPEGTKAKTCSAAHAISINGPAHTYSSTRSAELEGQEMRDLFQIKFKSNPINPNAYSKGTMVSAELLMKGRGYQDYLQRLHRRGLIAVVPTDRQIHGFFLIWAREAVEKFSK